MPSFRTKKSARRSGFEIGRREREGPKKRTEDFLLVKSMRQDDRSSRDERRIGEKEGEGFVLSDLEKNETKERGRLATRFCSKKKRK